MIEKLSDIADITLGTILTRVNAGLHDDAIKAETISMQEVSFYAGKSSIEPEKLFSNIKKDKINSCIFTQQGDVLLGLTSRSAMVIGSSRENMLVASNFLKIRIHDTNLLNPMYLCWLINENSFITNYFEKIKQGTAAVHVLTATEVRDIPIDIIQIEKQNQIAKFYKLYLEKYKLDLKLAEMNYKANNLIINKYFSEVKENEN